MRRYSFGCRMLRNDVVNIGRLLFLLLAAGRIRPHNAQMFGFFLRDAILNCACAAATVILSFRCIICRSAGAVPQRTVLVGGKEGITKFITLHGRRERFGRRILQFIFKGITGQKDGRVDIKRVQRIGRRLSHDFAAGIPVFLEIGWLGDSAHGRFVAPNGDNRFAVLLFVVVLRMAICLCGFFMEFGLPAIYDSFRRLVGRRNWCHSGRTIHYAAGR